MKKNPATSGRVVSRTPLGSPLTKRLAGVNILALFVLCGGLLYSGHYERQLIESELASLRAQAMLMSAALSQQALRDDYGPGAMLAADLARPALVRMIDRSQTPVRAVLLNRTGEILFDSTRMSGVGGVIDIQPLQPPFGSLSLPEKANALYRDALDKAPFRLQLPRHEIVFTGMYQSDPDIIKALAGETISTAGLDQNGGIRLTAAVPVQGILSVHGTLFLTRDGAAIDEAVYAVQSTVVKLFVIMLVFTLLMSVYLHETIARPLQSMARAAMEARFGRPSATAFPDYAPRGDEIGVLSAQFRLLIDALATRMQAIESFAADVRHEIRNPLTSLKSAVGLLRKGTLSRDEHARLIEIISDDAERMNMLLNAISSSSQIDSDIFNEARERIRIADFMEAQVAHHRSRHDGENAVHAEFTLDMDLGATGAYVKAHAVRLSQVITNIVDNALSFVTDGGHIGFHIGATADDVTIRIENNGPHIPERDLERIFTRFYTLRAPDERTPMPHSGLGLSICRQIVQSYGGIIYAANIRDGHKAGHGVCFTIILPRE